MKYNSWELKNNWAIDLMVEDRYRVLRHIVFLLGFLGLIYFSKFWNWYSNPYCYYVLFFAYSSLIVMVYINIYVLVPYFFFKTNYISYLILLALLGVIGLNFISFGLNNYFLPYLNISIPQKDEKGFYEGIMGCIAVILTTTTVKLLQKWTKDNIRITELSSLTLNMELNELRNQINPHFLFNMLNNVKALIRTDPETATTVIIKLSEFLRYQLYENSEEKTLLTSEIEFLSNFINLEKIRRENFSVEIHSDTDKRMLQSIFIPPNLFTTFVENAIKHSVNITGKESYIKITIEIEDKMLRFICSNSQDLQFSVSDKKYGGLGLANIKRRLELLYGKTYTLEMQSSKNEYIVTLNIPV
ncbi:two-component system LytT family sensor kinase [Chryseobacterium ginsenosidimutans]|uniref:sensor histidine kinase n=1 Tax=Chryseobacterium ginsenosidimutans TaxID=687846 RepID=UPI0027845446|nr:histidine kinase [Chryseobacterium ginsenosidimutans]MDQ0594857.1 two-component system LytT family sensor kinase [Chryseobacterium ginsenosidimutans]